MDDRSHRFQADVGCGVDWLAVPGFKVHRANYLRGTRPDKEENGGSTRLDGEAAGRAGAT
jgi:hypothetical protein